MKISTVKWLVCFFLVTGSSGKAFAQNILNDTVYVSMSSITEIIFNSPIDKTLMPNGNGSFETSVSGNAKSILVNASSKNAKLQPLIVNEGTREHKFILLYKDSVPPTRIDWSNLKKLKEHIARNQPLRATTPDEVTNTRSSENRAVNSDTGQNNNAVQPLQEAAPGNADKTFLEANALFKKRLWQQARMKYSQVRDPDLSDFVSFRLEEINKKIKEEEKKLAEQKKLSDSVESVKKFNDFVNTGAEALKQRDAPAAKRAYHEALRIRPGDPMLLSFLAQADQLEKEFRNNQGLQKIDSLKKAEYHKAIYIADRFYDAKDYNFAREEYKRAARIFPDSTYPASQLKKITQVRPDSSKSKVTKAGNNKSR